MGIRVGGRTVPVSLTAIPDQRLPSLAGTALTAGIRPEALTVVPDQRQDGTVLATVEHVECLGHETLAHVRIDGEGDQPVRLVVRAVGTLDVANGATIPLQIDPTRVYLFDADGDTLAGALAPDR
jgi:ABC-type sugar transport system ATPase subunit